MIESISERINTAEPAVGAPAPSWGADLVTQSGYAFHVRSASPSDEPALAEFFTHVDTEDLRFRFLSAIHKVGHDQLRALVSVDHERTKNFLAIEPASGSIIATAMLAADATLTNAEIAIAIRADFKRKGISWTLLDHVARFAVAKGIKTVESMESRENHAAIDLERERGWTASGCPDDPAVMVLRKTLDVALA